MAEYVQDISNTTNQQNIPNEISIPHEASTTTTILPIITTGTTIGTTTGTTTQQSSSWTIYNFFDIIKNETFNFIPKLLVSIIIFILFSVLANFVTTLIIGHTYDLENIKIESNIHDNNLESHNYNKNLIIRQLANLSYYTIIIIGLFFAIVNLGFQPGLIIGIFTVIAASFGLALSNTISNFIAGIYIATNNLFKIGDKIKVDNFVGTVYDFNLFNTVLIDDEKKNPLIVPNLKIQNGIITNFL
jgi:small-conductance mechanosensitive channel